MAFRQFVLGGKENVKLETRLMVVGRNIRRLRPVRIERRDRGPVALPSEIVGVATSYGGIRA